MRADRPARFECLSATPAVIRIKERARDVQAEPVEDVSVRIDDPVDVFALLWW